MFGANNIGTLSFDLHVDPAGGETYLLWRAPVDATIKRFTVQTNKTQNAGTATTYALHNYGTAGTAIKSSGGTAAVALGGTASASRLTADVPATTTTILNAYVAAGEYLVLAYAEEGSGWQSGQLDRVQVDYVIGKSADNA
jgi:hypothetical protein